jgi:hypothetical protein
MRSVKHAEIQQEVFCRNQGFAHPSAKRASKDFKPAIAGHFGYAPRIVDRFRYAEDYSADPAGTGFRIASLAMLELKSGLLSPSTANLASELHLQVGQPHVILPAVAADRFRMAAS